MTHKSSISALVTTFSISDKGNHKPLNEDAVIACPEIGLWVVADGMGGHEGGAIASQLAVNYITQAVKNGTSLVDAIEQAHHEITRVASTVNGKVGMGTTVVATQLIGNEFKIAWVGDSRAYLFDHTTLTQLTHDHTIIQELIDKGEINESQSKIHPQRHIISQALGGNKDIHVDFVTGLLNNNILMLCSDGLSNELTNEKIITILSDSCCLKDKAKKLIESVLLLKGADNITASLLQKF